MPRSDCLAVALVVEATALLAAYVAAWAIVCRGGEPPAWLEALRDGLLAAVVLLLIAL